MFVIDVCAWERERERDVAGEIREKIVVINNNIIIHAIVVRCRTMGCSEEFGQAHGLR